MFGLTKRHACSAARSWASRQPPFSSCAALAPFVEIDAREKGFSWQRVQSNVDLTKRLKPTYSAKPPTGNLYRVPTSPDPAPPALGLVFAPCCAKVPPACRPTDTVITAPRPPPSLLPPAGPKGTQPHAAGLRARRTSFALGHRPLCTDDGRPSSRADARKGASKVGADNAGEDEDEDAKEYPRGDCVVCGTSTRKHCSGCKTVWYCSKACQRSDWEAGHSAACSGLRRRPGESKDRAQDGWDIMHCIFGGEGTTSSGWRRPADCAGRGHSKGDSSSDGDSLGAPPEEPGERREDIGWGFCGDEDGGKVIDAWIEITRHRYLGMKDNLNNKKAVVRAMESLGCTLDQWFANHEALIDGVEDAYRNVATAWVNNTLSETPDAFSPAMYKLLRAKRDRWIPLDAEPHLTIKSVRAEVLHIELAPSFFVGGAPKHLNPIPFYLHYVVAAIFGNMEIVATVLLTAEEGCLERPHGTADSALPPTDAEMKEVKHLWTVTADLGGEKTSFFSKVVHYGCLGLGTERLDQSDQSMLERLEKYPVRWKLTDINMLVHTEYRRRQVLKNNKKTGT